MLKRLLNEPMVYFCIVGALVYYFYTPDVTDKDLTDSVIQLPSRFIDDQKDKFSQQYQRQPSQEELQGIIDQEVNSEVLFREAWRLQLYVGDTVVRKRMIQKMQFLLEEGSATQEISEGEIESYFLTHKNEFPNTQKIDLFHVLFGNKQDAQRYVELLKTEGGSAPDTAKGVVAFPLGNVFTQISEKEVTKYFGKGFYENVDLAALDQWQGPVKSRYGFHVVKLNNVSAAKDVEFSSVRENIRKKLIEMTRVTSRQEAVEAIKKRYHVEVMD